MLSFEIALVPSHRDEESSSHLRRHIPSIPTDGCAKEGLFGDTPQAPNHALPELRGDLC